MCLRHHGIWHPRSCHSSGHYQQYHAKLPRHLPTLPLTPRPIHCRLSAACGGLPHCSQSGLSEEGHRDVCSRAGRGAHCADFFEPSHSRPRRQSHSWRPWREGEPRCGAGGGERVEGHRENGGQTTRKNAGRLLRIAWKEGQIRVDTRERGLSIDPRRRSRCPPWTVSGNRCCSV